MLLHRLGSKTKLLPKLLELFPENITTFIDMFMGTGAVSFAMIDRVKYIIANDNDEEVFNLFMVLKDHKYELIEAIDNMPVHESLFTYWKQQQEYDCVWRAVRFLMLSNFGYLGKPGTLSFENHNPKQCLLLAIEEDYKKRVSNKFQYMYSDFRQVLSKVHWRHDTDKQQGFIYAVPPYLETDNNYQGDFTEQDTQDLFELLVNSDIRFALSEFDNPFVLDLAEQYRLHVTELSVRQNLKNRRTEILITNYEPMKRQTSLFDER